MPEASSFTDRDVEEILRVVDRLSDIEVWLETGDIKLHVRKFSGTAPATEATAAPSAPPSTSSNASPERQEEPSSPGASSAVAAEADTGAAEKDAGLEPGTVAIRAPIVGNFYRAPSPADPPFVEPGQEVGPNDPVCLIEVMKLFTTVNAGVSGTIVRIVAEDGATVDEDDILFVVRPAE